jgi:hypothetical protein
MPHARFTPNPHRRKARHITRTLTLAALASLAIAPIAEGAAGTHLVKVNSTIFAAQIGSTTTGGRVYAGAVVDPKLRHGAIVFSITGNTALHVTFHEFFARGSISGSGHVAVVPGTNGRQTFTGSLKVTGGTGEYRNSQGKLNAKGNINRQRMVKAALRGSFTH